MCSSDLNVYDQGGNSRNNRIVAANTDKQRIHTDKMLKSGIKKTLIKTRKVNNVLPNDKKRYAAPLRASMRKGDLNASRY